MLHIRMNNDVPYVPYLADARILIKGVVCCE